MSIVSKRFRASGSLLVAVAIGTILFAGAAQAEDPYSTQPAVAASTQTPDEGGSFTLTGTGYLPGETVNNVLHSAPYALASAVAGSTGSFSVSVTLPSGVTGSHTISSTGVTSGRAASVAITVDPASSGGPLASTGAAVIRIGSVAVLALIVGGLALVAGRRRKTRV